MKVKLTGIFVGLGLLVGGLTVQTNTDLAQGRSQVILSNEAGHAVTPPLGSMPPLSTEGIANRAIPLRYPHPIFGASQPPPDGALQTVAGPLVSASTGQNFSGVGVGLGSTTSDQYAPPDTNGAVGGPVNPSTGLSSQFVQWVNVSFAVFDTQSGSVLYGPAAGNTLWSKLGGPCAANNSGDPIAQYDKQAGHWVMMQPVFKNPYYICAAVSATSDATGSWYVYAFPVPGNVFPDYPKLSVWPDGYYLSYNQFKGNTFTGAAACVLDRTNMMAGNTANPMQCFTNLGSSVGSLLPSDLDGSTAPPSGASATFMNFGTNSLNLWQFHVDWNTPSSSTLTGPTTLGVAQFSEACGGGACVPQPNTKEQLDSLGDRLMYRLAYRNFSTAGYQDIVATHSVAVGSGSKRSPGNTGIRWYELRNNGKGWSVYQQGTYAPDSNFRWMGSIAMDKVGDIAVGYSVSSGSVYPSIRYTGRVPNDAVGPGNMEAENSIISGTGSQVVNLNRWGDYSSMSVDPLNDCTFWYTNEYLIKSGTFNWSTQIASFKFSGCN